MDEEFTQEAFLKAVDEAISQLTPEGRAATDQGISHIRELSKNFCENIEYGDDGWKEVWTTAALTMYTLLASISEVYPIPKEMIDGITLEFMLIGSGDRLVEIEGLEDLKVEGEK